MRIYLSGLGGVGIGPLAQLALEAGHDVLGSDLAPSPMTEQLQKMSVQVFIGQDGSQIAEAHAAQPIDQFVHTAALPADHPELQFCRENNIAVAKRDELVNHLIRTHNLKMIAAAGTHGKTTATGMLIWVLQQLRVPASYTIGTTIGFGPSGHFAGDGSFFIYECDEYDRNFLQFQPDLSLILSLDYDHPDIYPTREDYQAAFAQFLEQSSRVVMWDDDYRRLPDTQADVEAFEDESLEQFTLAGAHNRRNAFLVYQAVKKLLPDTKDFFIIAALNSFPGTHRRFEKLADNLYSDYGHHPVEIAATVQMALELNPRVVVVYQPHQNSRQHEILAEYGEAFAGAERVFWLPTYLSRENDLPVLTPAELIARLNNNEIAQPAEMNDDLWRAVEAARAEGALVVAMSAGDLDGWVRASLNREL